MGNLHVDDDDDDDDDNNNNNLPPWIRSLPTFLPLKIKGFMYISNK